MVAPRWQPTTGVFALPARPIRTSLACDRVTSTPAMWIPAVEIPATGLLVRGTQKRFAYELARSIVEPRTRVSGSTPGIFYSSSRRDGATPSKTPARVWALPSPRKWAPQWPETVSNASFAKSFGAIDCSSQVVVMSSSSPKKALRSCATTSCSMSYVALDARCTALVRSNEAPVRDEASLARADSNLPVDAFAAARSRMSLRAVLFSLYSDVHRTFWSAARRLVRHPADRSLPSLESRGLRSTAGARVRGCRQSWRRPERREQRGEHERQGLPTREMRPRSPTLGSFGRESRDGS